MLTVACPAPGVSELFLKREVRREIWPTVSAARWTLGLLAAVFATSSVYAVEASEHDGCVVPHVVVTKLLHHWLQQVEVK